jgi:Ca2+-binding RTX toxin-like protein
VTKLFESLETRWLLASYYTSPIFVSGTSGNDYISIWQNGNIISIYVNGVTKTYASSYSEPGATPYTSGPTYSVPKIVVNGLAGHDQILADNTVQKRLEISGGPGSDRIRGGAFGDWIFGGAPGSANNEAGFDTLEGGLGSDTIVAAKYGTSRIYGGDGNDTVTCGSGWDSAYGGAGDDSITGNDGYDTLFGEAGRDTLLGGWGQDCLAGGSGDDYLDGGGMNDLLKGELGNDALFGSAGFDRLEGSNGNDWMDGGSEADTMSGDAGADTLQGFGGNDVLLGGSEGDWLEGGDGDDWLDGGWGSDTLKGQAGADVLLGAWNNDWLGGGTENDSLDGGAGRDSMHGEAGRDTLRASQGNESLSGGENVHIAVDSHQTQDDDNTCGPNSAARLLRSYGIAANYQALKAQVAAISQTADNNWGTPPPELLEVMRLYKANSQLQSGGDFQTILNLLAQGRPVIALVGWGEHTFPVPYGGFFAMVTVPQKLHYIVLTGFDLQSQTLFYTDTNGEQKSYTFAAFQDRWDWPGSQVGYQILKDMGINKKTILW